MLIINADDWGRSSTATDCAAMCYKDGRISSTTAMVFMQDSQRGAEIANTLGIPVGLHLNLDETFTQPQLPAEIQQAHSKVRRYLSISKYASALFNPLIGKQLDLVFRAQWSEFVRLFGKEPTHIDGHHHMHLCANILAGKVLPPGSKVRRSFSFFPGEKSWVNRWYRSWVDRRLLRSHRSTDYFFDLSSRCSLAAFRRVTILAEQSNVELMAHPEREGERRFLMGEELGKEVAGVGLGSYLSL